MLALLSSSIHLPVILFFCLLVTLVFVPEVIGHLVECSGVLILMSLALWALSNSSISTSLSSSSNENMKVSNFVVCFISQNRAVVENKRYCPSSYPVDRGLPLRDCDRAGCWHPVYEDVPPPAIQYLCLNCQKSPTNYTTPFIYTLSSLVRMPVGLGCHTSSPFSCSNAIAGLERASVLKF